jgi:hypothetical protein
MTCVIYIESDALGRAYFTDIDDNKATWLNRAAAERQIDLLKRSVGEPQNFIYGVEEISQTQDSDT